jgi:hypothetical protein
MNLKPIATALLGATVLSAGIAGSAFAKKVSAPRRVVNPAISSPGGPGGSPGGGYGGGAFSLCCAGPGGSGNGLQGGAGGSID